MKVLLALLGALLAVTLAGGGCATLSQMMADTGAFGDVVPGETTEAELLERFPEPDQQRALANGGTEFTWTHHSLRDDHPLVAAMIDDVIAETGEASTGLVVRVDADGIVEAVHVPGADRTVRTGEEARPWSRFLR